MCIIIIIIIIIIISSSSSSSSSSNSSSSIYSARPDKLCTSGRGHLSVVKKICLITQQKTTDSKYKVEEILPRYLN